MLQLLLFLIGLIFYKQQLDRQIMSTLGSSNFRALGATPLTNKILASCSNLFANQIHFQFFKPMGLSNKTTLLTHRNTGLQKMSFTTFTNTIL